MSAPRRLRKSPEDRAFHAIERTAFGSVKGQIDSAGAIQNRVQAGQVSQVQPASSSFAKHHLVLECYSQPLIANNTITDIIWDTLDEDTGDVVNAYSLPTAGPFTIQADGLFSAALMVGWMRPSPIAGEIWCSLTVPDTLQDNSSNPIGVDSRSIDAGPGVQQEQSVCFPLDWWATTIHSGHVKASVWQTSGAGLNINYAALVISRLGP
jgi:hypothetical protein